MLTFETGLDARTRQVPPSVAKFNIGNGVYRYVVIGTDYGHVRLASGDVRTWKSYSGARRYLRNNYAPCVK